MASNYELVKLILKPPLRIIGITAEMVRPVKPECDEQFSSLEEVYACFRKKRPKGRWLIWVQGSDGQEMPIDSKKWEEMSRHKKKPIRVIFDIKPRPASPAEKAAWRRLWDKLLTRKGKGINGK